MRTALVVGCLTAAMTLTGCAADTKSDAPSGNPVFDKLPADVQDSGVLQVGAMTTLAPYLYREGDEVVGSQKELLDALGKEMGVEVEITDSLFPGIIPGLQSGKFDIAMFAFTDTKERQEAVDFVDYVHSYSTLLVQRGNPQNVSSPDDLCGTKVAVIPGAVGDTVASEQDSKCKADGKEGVTEVKFEDAPTSMTAVRSGRADVFIIDYVIGRHAADESDELEAVGEPFYEQFLGAAVRKDNAEMQEALVAAFTEITRNGEYARILKKWNIEKVAMESPLVNAATS